MHRLLLLLAFASAGAHACSDPRPAPIPHFELKAVAPRLVRAVSSSHGWIEFERKPALQRTQVSLEQHHAAQPDTRYRYRARQRMDGDCPPGTWSAWASVRTPREPIAPPRAPQRLEGKSAARFVVSLRWQFGGNDADGFVIERCPGEAPCLVAAVLNPDQRAFDMHSLRAARYRITAFNALGYSAPSALTGVLGIDEPEQAKRPEVTLGPGDSAAADAIAQWAGARSDEDARCTSPAKLIEEGFKLVGVRGVDLYQEPGACGSGGCMYVTYSIRDDGCYAQEPGSDVLATKPPFSGTEDAPGVVVAGGNGSAANGVVVIYEDTAEVDRYDWETIGPPYPGQFPPFGSYSSVQFPEHSDIVLDEGEDD